MIVGAPFSPKEIAEAVRQNKIPEFWARKLDQEEPKLPGPTTRERAKIEEKDEIEHETEQRKSLDQLTEQQLQPSTQAEEETPLLDTILRKKRVRFNI
jgi:hypothetical protein